MTDPFGFDGDKAHSRREILRGLGAVAGASVLSTAGRGAQTGPAEGIQREVWVETGTDTDNTGRSDRVHVQIRRPDASGPDQQVPVVLRPNPYRGPYRGIVENVPGLNAQDEDSSREAMEVPLYNPAASTTESAASASTVAPDAAQNRDDYPYDDLFVSEGYAFCSAAPIGSSLSTGCNRLGGPAELRSITAVVDWLNDRATAYDAREDGDAVTAAWTGGTTGIFGESYRGALANGVATRDPDGLETIVSMRSLSSWYSFLRSGGAVITPKRNPPVQGPSRKTRLATLSRTVTTRPDAQRRCAETIAEMNRRTDWETGNYNDFWAARNYLADADEVSASVLLVHGLYDPRTRPWEFSRWLEALKEQGLPYNVWLHQGGHGDPIDRHEDPWVDRLLAWYDYWLKGEDTGVMDDPAAVVEREDGDLARYADWPDPNAESVSLTPRPDGTALGGLGFESVEAGVTESFVDDPTTPPTAFLGDEYTDNRLVYRTAELESAVRVSGTVRPTLGLSFDSETALVSGALVDYGPGFTDIVNRGWTNPSNRNSVRESELLVPGRLYEIDLALQPVDYVFEEGHRIGFVLYGSDYNVTKRPPQEPELTLHLAESTVPVPIVGGRDALTASTDESGEETADDGGPGFGFGGALTGVAGAGYLLKRRGDGEHSRD